MQLELLSEVIQGQKNKYCMISLMCIYPSFEFRVLYLNVNECRATTKPQMIYFLTLTVAEPMDIREMMS